MTKVRIQAGAELDIASSADVATAVGGLETRLGRALISRRPTYQKRSDSIQVPGASTLLAFDLGTPPAGKVWLITNMVVTVVDDGVFTPGGTGLDAALFVGNLTIPRTQAAATAALPTMAELVTVLPDGESAWSPSTPYPVFDNDQVYAIATADGTGAVVFVTVNVLYQEFDDSVLVRGSV